MKFILLHVIAIKSGVSSYNYTLNLLIHTSINIMSDNITPACSHAHIMPGIIGCKKNKE